MAGLRGSQTLFADIFFEQPTTTTLKKGRNTELYQKRNDFLLSRYYFYGAFFDNKLNYPWIVKRVADEFFLSPVTVAEVIDTDLATLKTLKKERPTIAELRIKYPHIVWDTKLILLQNLSS